MYFSRILSFWLFTEKVLNCVRAKAISVDRKATVANSCLQISKRKMNY